MLIIFGTRPYFRRNKVTQHGFCVHCNRFSKMSSYDAMKFFHVYYLPLIPIMGTRRHHKMCTKCNTGHIFEPSAFAGIINNFKGRAADAIAAVQEGDATFVSDEADAAPVESVPFLHDVVDWLYASKNIGFCEGMLAQLGGPNCKYAAAMLNASLETMKGKLENAIAAYSEASACAPNSYEPHQLRAHLLAERRRYGESAAAYQAALNLTEDGDIRYVISLQMVEQQMAAKNYLEASATYDRIVAMKPEVIQYADFAKSMKKAKKKAGLT